MMVCLWLSASGVGVLSSRTLALACERPLAFMAMGGQERPDFRTLSAVRTRHLEAFKDGCVQVGRLASEAGRVPWGNVSTEGPNIQGHASRHKAMRSGSRKKEVERLREDLEALGPQAQPQEEADEAALGSRRGDALPAELTRRASAEPPRRPSGGARASPGGVKAPPRSRRAPQTRPRAT